jgi:hypothetical protein
MLCSLISLLILKFYVLVSKYIKAIFFPPEGSSNSNNSGLESINVITNALGSRSVSLREMMRRATAAVRSSGKKSLFPHACFCFILHNKAWCKIICVSELSFSAECTNFLISYFG